VHDYAAAHQTQLYYGTIVHQVLDRAHAHYQGVMDPTTKGTLPTDDDIKRYFDEVDQSLRSRGIRAVSPKLQTKAIRLLQYFNALEGPTLYPKVVDTEHRLQSDQKTHILHGVVDLLTNTGAAGDPADGEMWDYKGKSRIGLTPTEFETYELQMRVYARLYELKHGVLPKRAILYFINELEGPTCPTTRPVNAVLEVSMGRAEIDAAMVEFTKTVGDIEAARASDRWDPATYGVISESDCTICDLRWDCPTPNNGAGVPLRYP
jgi:putative RecB family exonuclease